MPAGLLVTVPLPPPPLLNPDAMLIVRPYPAGFRPNVAVHVLLAVIVTFPSKQSESPLQPANIEPEAGVEIRETMVPEEYTSEQSLPHVMPAGLLVTDPPPFPNFVKFRVNVAIGMVAQDSLEGLETLLELNARTR
jgi:hypothetical protein